MGGRGSSAPAGLPESGKLAANTWDLERAGAVSHATPSIWPPSLTPPPRRDGVLDGVDLLPKLCGDQESRLA